MKKIIVRAADYAMTDSITDGCLKAIRDGILTDVGLMTNNYQHAKRAVEEVLKYPHVSIGQDFNLVSGIPASDPKDIPSLVDETGTFISSVERKKNNLMDIPYDEIYHELKAQVERFIAFVGRKPSYGCGHSLNTPEVLQAMQDICKEYDFVWDCFEQENIQVGERWYFKNQKTAGDHRSGYSLDQQAQEDVIAHIINGELNFDDQHEYGTVATHCGYCDGELLHMSTFSVVRGIELEALCSPEVKQWIKTNNFELISFDQYMQETHGKSA